MRISVVIPTFNEALLVERSVGNAWNCGADEVVLSDGGSSDDTLAIANSLDCVTCESRPGRGIQLNAGAQLATGDVLLFLHADAVLAASGCQQIRSAISTDPTIACGAFKQSLDNERLIYRLIELGNACRCSTLQMAYGDQGMFVCKQLFFELGEFDEIPLMEDFRFSQKLRRRNATIRKRQKDGNAQPYRFKLLPGPLKVDTRRWETNGPIRQTFANWLTTIAYLRGADPNELAKKYYGKSSVDSGGIPIESQSRK